MEATTNRLVEAGHSAIQAASGIAVAYAFSILGAIILLVVGYIVAGLAERWLHAGLKRVRGFDETLRIFFSKVLRYAILILVGITVLAQFGVQTASIIAALGAIGLAIGLALQGTLQNIASGIMLLVLRPFRVGEYTPSAVLQAQCSRSACLRPNSGPGTAFTSWRPTTSFGTAP
jgi:small conductance mechanosensitive channel